MSAARGTPANSPDQQPTQNPNCNENLLLGGWVERVRHIPQADAQPDKPRACIHSIVLGLLRVVSRHCDGILAIFEGEFAGQSRQRVHRVCRPIERLDGQAPTPLARPEEDDYYREDPNQPPLRGIWSPHDAGDFT